MAVKTGPLGLPGNEALQGRILNYLRGGRIHPALLLTGPDREDKLALARAMAKYLVCPERACGRCNLCRRIDRDHYADVLILREEGEEIIKIDAVRELCHQMEVSPIEGSWKIAVVEDCHRMNVAAANAFLKTLEEPGPNRLFLLLTSQPGSLLPTILSRCLEFTLKPRLTAEQPDEGDAERESLLAAALRTGDNTELIASLKEREDGAAFVRFLQRRLRTQVLAGGPDDPASGAALRRYEAALELEGRLRSNANYALMVDGFLREHFLMVDGFLREHF